MLKEIVAKRCLSIQEICVKHSVERSSKVRVFFHLASIHNGGKLGWLLAKSPRFKSIKKFGKYALLCSISSTQRAFILSVHSTPFHPSCCVTKADWTTCKFRLSKFICNLPSRYSRHVRTQRFQDCPLYSIWTLILSWNSGKVVV